MYLCNEFLSLHDIRAQLLDLAARMQVGFKSRMLAWSRPCDLSPQLSMVPPTPYPTLSALTAAEDTANFSHIIPASPTPLASCSVRVKGGTEITALPSHGGMFSNSLLEPSCIGLRFSIHCLPECQKSTTNPYPFPSAVREKPLGDGEDITNMAMQRRNAR